MRVLARFAASVAMLALAGCVGAPAGSPVAGYPPAPGYGQPPIYAPGPNDSVPAQQVALGGRCYAGIYACALPQALPVGAQCSCPGLGAPSFGNVR